VKHTERPSLRMNHKPHRNRFDHREPRVYAKPSNEPSPSWQSSGLAEPVGRAKTAVAATIVAHGRIGRCTYSALSLHRPDGNQARARAGALIRCNAATKLSRAAQPAATSERLPLRARKLMVHPQDPKVATRHLNTGSIWLFTPCLTLGCVRRDQRRPLASLYARVRKHYPIKRAAGGRKGG
jgi:hypothetical protein